MADMDSMSVWRVASGGSELGMAWRDAVARRIMRSPTCTPYDGLVADQAAPLGLSADAPGRPFREWRHMRPWPDAQALAGIDLPS